MPIVVSLLGGAGVAYALIASGRAIEAVALLTVWIALLWIWPPAAVWTLTIGSALAAVAIVVVFWEFFAAVALAAFLFVFLVGGILHAIHYYHERLL
jgi:hypothetical protein